MIKWIMKWEGAFGLKSFHFDCQFLYGLNTKDAFNLTSIQYFMRSFDLICGQDHIIFIAIKIFSKVSREKKNKMLDFGHP